MNSSPECLLTLNGGSSSIKFAVYIRNESPERGLYGRIERIGLLGTTLTFTYPVTNKPASCLAAGADHASAVKFLVDWLENRCIGNQFGYARFT
ncbi:hypothetical protein BH09BAC4_BH09BAC4_12820 [soil metagenome]